MLLTRSVMQRGARSIRCRMLPSRSEWISSLLECDLYDIGLKSFESTLFFNKQMVRLNDAGIDVYRIHGNHDAASKLIK